jgi:hypothetical protein
MKHLILLSVFISLNTFSASDTCPPFQNLIDLNENFELSIKSRKEVKGSIDLEVGKSQVYESALMTISSHSQSLSIPKGTELPLMFVSNSSYNEGDSSKDQDRSVSGVLLVENRLERVDFTINDRSSKIPTVKDLETALGDSFSISCTRKEISTQESTKSKSTSVSNQ